MVFAMKSSRVMSISFFVVIGILIFVVLYNSSESFGSIVKGFLDSIKHVSDLGPHFMKQAGS